MGNVYEEMEFVNDPANNPDANVYSRMESEKAPAFSVGRNIAEPYNRGVLGMLDFPVNMMNAGIALLDAADRYTAKNVWGVEPNSAPPPQLTAPFTEAGRRVGVIAPPEEQRHGLVPRAMEFTGAGMVPFAGLTGVGNKAIGSAMTQSGASTINYNRLALADLSPVPTALSQIGRATAANPATMTAFDIASNFTAASGGTVARKFTDNETIIAVAELGSAFLPTAAFIGFKALPTGRLVDKVSDWVLETLLPFTEKGGMVSGDAGAMV
jgi:hypothetical protein